MQRHVPLSRGPGPTRYQGLPRRRQPLAAVSPAHRQQQAAQRRAYEAAEDAEQGWCECCKLAGPVHHSHLFSQGLHKMHRNNRLNWLVSCWDCHMLFEHRKQEFAARYPAAWARVLRQMEQVDPVAFRAWRLKNHF